MFVGEYYKYGGSQDFLYCVDYKGHTGAACKRCIAESTYSDEEKKKMLNDFWDWNFCNPYLHDTLKFTTVGKP
jgi:hypothetical protein